MLPPPPSDVREMPPSEDKILSSNVDGGTRIVCTSLPVCSSKENGVYTFIPVERGWGTKSVCTSPPVCSSKESGVYTFIPIERGWGTKSVCTSLPVCSSEDNGEHTID